MTKMQIKDWVRKVIFAAVSITLIKNQAFAASNSEVRLLLDEALTIDTDSNVIGDTEQTIYQSYKFLMHNWAYNSGEKIADIRLTFIPTDLKIIEDKSSRIGNCSEIYTNSIVCKDVLDNDGAGMVFLTGGQKKIVPPFSIKRDVDNVFFESTGTHIITIKVTSKENFIDISMQIYYCSSYADAKVLSASMDPPSIGNCAIRFTINNPEKGKEYILKATLQITPNKEKVSYLPEIWAEFIEFNTQTASLFNNSASISSSFETGVAISSEDQHFLLSKKKYFGTSFHQTSLPTKVTVEEVAHVLPTSSVTLPPNTILPSTEAGMNWVIIEGIGAQILLGIIAIPKLGTRYNKRSKTIIPETVLIGAPKEPEVKGTIDIKSAHEYNDAKVFYKVKLENNTLETIDDIKINLFVPYVFLLNEKEKSLSMLEPKESKTVTFEIRPTEECEDCNVSGKIDYYGYSTKRREVLDIVTKTVSVVCPVLTRKEIDVRQWEQVTDELIKAEENIKELSAPAENLFNITSRVLKEYDLFRLKPEITSTPQLFEGFAMFYAEDVTGLRYAAYIEVIGGAHKSRLILRAWADKEAASTGFYHRILDKIEKRIDVKIFIDDIVQYNVHIGDSIGTKIKGDVVAVRSTIGAGACKCPDCGKEVEANETFCPECVG